MGVRFIIGRAGTGKTTWCFNHIVASLRADPLGPAIFWILPRQATFQAERELTCASGLDGFFRCRVVSFEELGREVLADCGGAAIPQITAHGRHMILRLLLRKHQDNLRFYRGSAQQAGLAQRLDNTIADLERAGRGVEDLASLAEELAGGSDHPAAQADLALADKIHDLHLLYDAYARYLGQERLDPHRRLQQVLTCLRNWRVLQDATVYIDAFNEFTAYERQVITTLAQTCRDLSITLLMDPSSPLLADPHPLPADLSLFHRTESTYRTLRIALEAEGVVIDEPILLHEPRRFTRPGLSAIEAHLFDDAHRKPLPPDGVTFIEAHDRRGEADAAARCVRELTRRGLRYRDIAILMRGIDDYHELIDASFREHGIPYFVDRRRIVTHHPLLQLVRSALLVALGGWPQDAMFSILKSGLAGLTLDQADELENYVLAHRIHGDAWSQPDPWTYARRITRRDADDVDTPDHPPDAQRADALRRRLIDPLLPFVRALHQPDLTVRKIVTAMLELLEALGVRTTLATWILDAEHAGRLEEKAEHEQVWTELVELLDQMVELIGDEPVDLPDFLSLMETGLAQFDLAITPPTVDQVLVGQLDRTRTTTPRAVILIGMNEGLFPRTHREDSILSDADRCALRDRQIEVDPDSERQVLDENLLAYIATTRARESLILIRSLADDAGRQTLPSPYWRRLQELQPDNRPYRLPRAGEDDPSFISTPRQLVCALMRWVRRGPGPEDERQPHWPALYQWLAEHKTCTDAIDVMRYRAWKALSYVNGSTLSPDTARKLFASPLRASISQLETFAQCPFKHFVSYGLRLELRDPADPTAIDLSRIYHSTLERLVGELLRRRVDLAAMPQPLAAELIQQATQQAGQALRGELMISSARNRYLLDRIERTVQQFADAQRAIAARGQFRPKWTNLAFGTEHSRLPPLALDTPAGHRLELHGRIDRVDLLEQQAAFAVIDYRMGDVAGMSATNVYYGLSLQLLASLLIMQNHGQTLTGKSLTPAAALCVRLLRQIEKIAHPGDAPSPDDELFHLWPRQRGIINQRFLECFDEQLQPGEDSAVLPVRINQNGTIAKSCTDVATDDELRKLLDFVRTKLAQIADQILEGDARVFPYRLGTSTPCGNCQWRSLCRFQPGIDSYNFIQPVARADLVEGGST